MTIAKRLIILLTVPLVALVGLGVFTRLQLAQDRGAQPVRRGIADRGARHAGESVPGFRRTARERAQPSAGDRRRATRRGARALFDEDEQDVNRLLQEYADSLVLGDKDRRLLGDYQTLSREWIAGAKQAMLLADRRPA